MIHQYTLDALGPRIAGAASESNQPAPTVAEVGAFLIEVVTSTGRAAAVELRIKRDTVEVWHRDHLSGVFVRDELRAWLSDTDPRRRALVVDEVAFSVDRMVDAGGRTAITLPDVLMWTLDPHTLDRLRSRV